MKTVVKKERQSIFMLFSLLWMAVTVSGCIHEYPVDGGVDPSAIELGVELTLNLTWDQEETQALFGTRARGETAIRLVTEVSFNGERIGRDVTYLSEDEVSDGIIRRKLPFALHALNYDIAVWCDAFDASESTTLCDVTDLMQIRLHQNDINLTEPVICGYASDNLDLRRYKGQWDIKLLKEMTLTNAAARFKLITTDMRKFVEEELHAIENGETYTVTFNFNNDTPDAFNAYTGAAVRNYGTVSLTGALKPSYTIFGDQDLGGGIVFCDAKDNVTMFVTVHNSARMLVVKSPEFKFKVKRGMISVVTGEFLSEKFSSNLKIDNVWEGEIVIEVN